MTPYHDMVAAFARLVREGRAHPLGGFPALPQPVSGPDAPRVLIFSPHPDDEVIIGGLALRLMRESGWRVVNVAVTQGSKRERQAGRLEELRRCCACIGFDVVQTAPAGLECVTLKTRSADPAHWRTGVEVVAGILRQHAPAVTLFPHDQDWNSTHVGTHWLVMDALARLPSDFTCHVVETEFWGQMATPNLMVELSAPQLGDLITALTFHVEEVRRNPYHLSLPAWMMDNVRRGAELVGGQGGGAPDYMFATLYRLRRWRGGKLEPVYEGGRYLPVTEPAGNLFG
jgi:LmbE family N-acetylglucosaminyl deacetylase